MDNSYNGKILSFRGLTPVNINDISGYEEALDFVFKSRDLFNIAITGPYGSGKSSVLKSYMERHREKHVIHISLANFKDLYAEPEISAKKSDNETKKLNDIQSKILSQLIHKMKIDKSLLKFNLIDDKKCTTLFCYTICIMTLFLIPVILNIYGFDKFIELLIKQNIWSISILGIWIITFGYSTYIFLKKQFINPIFKKIKMFSGNEIELSDKNSLYFDKYIDDILFIFSKSSVDAIVFEDIDRFEKSKIFTQLREINVLINTKLNKKVRFIYLLRDDIWSSNDRTKFFDFIIPIIPVVTGANSIDKISELDFIKDQVDSGFLDKVSYYLDDMRLINNIVNEFTIYSHRLRENNLDSNKLFAMIVYKNTFPKDFSELQYGKGYVYGLLNEQKIELLNRKQDSFKNEKRKLFTKITELENEKLKDINELYCLYIKELYLENNNVQYIGDQPIGTLKTNLAIVSALRSNDFQVKRYNETILENSWIKNIFSDIERLEEFKRRKTIIEEKKSNKIKEYETEISEYNKEINYYSHKSFNELLPKECLRELFIEFGTTEICEDTDDKKRNLYYIDIKSNKYFDLLIFLLSEGRIYENDYNDYLTHMYGNFLSNNDRFFLRDINSSKLVEYSYNIHNAERVIEKILESDFSRGNIFNFDLVENMLKSDHKFLINIVEQIRYTKKYDFVFAYINANRDGIAFIKRINSFYPQFWHDMATLGKATYVELCLYLQYSMTASSQGTINMMNIGNGDLKTFINSCKEFLCINDKSLSQQIDREVFIDNLCCLDIKFDDIEANNCDEILLRKVYDKNLYGLNRKMIGLMMSKFLNMKKSTVSFEKNYTQLNSINGGKSGLLEYVNNNINEYIEIWSNEDILQDDEKYVLSIFNNEDITIDAKLAYLAKSVTLISNIADIRDSNIWGDFLTNRKLVFSLANIVTYYAKNIYYKDMNEDKDEKEVEEVEKNKNIFDNYLNSSDIISLDNYNNKNYENEILSGFFVYIINNPSENMDVTKVIIENINRYYANFQLKGKNIDVVKILIDLNKIGVSEDSLDNIRKNYEDLLQYFVEKNIEKYVLLCEKIGVENFMELQEILLNKKINVKYKRKLIRLYGEPIAIKDSQFSNDVIVAILRECFDVMDLDYLVTELYDKSLRKDFKNAIVKIALGHKNEVRSLNNVSKIILDILDSDDKKQAKKHQ